MSAKVRFGLIASGVVVILAACSSSNLGNVVNRPKLVSDSEKQKRDPNQGGAFNTISAVDSGRGFPMTANVDSDLCSNHDNVWNDGVAFDGLKIIVRGQAFSQGFLGQPKTCQIEVRNRADLNKTTATASGVFAPRGVGEYTAIVPTVHCTDSIAFDWCAPALKHGTANFEVSLAPLDNSCPAVIFEHPCVIGAALGLQPATASPEARANYNGAVPETQFQLGQDQVQKQ